MTPLEELEAITKYVETLYPERGNLSNYALSFTQVFAEDGDFFYIDGYTAAFGDPNAALGLLTHTIDDIKAAIRG